MNRILPIFLITMFTSYSASAVSEGNAPIAFAAVIKDQAAAAAAIKLIEKQHLPLENAGIENLQFFTQKIADKDIILATMDMNESAPSKIPDNAWTQITGAPLFKDAFAQLNQNLLPHPRNPGTEKSPWVRAETICVIRPDNAAPISKNDHPWYAAVTGLKKEKEAEYRLLHNNVWPGVVDAIGASNINRFDIFLIELGDPEKNQPYLFYLFQYTGKDFDKDMAAQSNSPVNQRWWKFTDACQQPLPAAAAEKKVWLDMKKLP
ncbi:hypothetical protein NT6N_20140 [Oceaniferula spumae]|uniref:L-rhamnose mutarotase n=1 Tax=Oceaniferula spumae TaxID=2979115 RepID=A0AAT9FLY1_9BACT